MPLITPKGWQIKGFDSHPSMNLEVWSLALLLCLPTHHWWSAAERQSVVYPLADLEFALSLRGFTNQAHTKLHLTVQE